MDLKILEIASDTENNKNIKNYTHAAKSKNPLCGDEIQIKLVIEDEKIVDFGYQGKSCVYCQATASLLSKKLINRVFQNNVLFVNVIVVSLSSGQVNRIVVCGFSNAQATI